MIKFQKPIMHWFEPRDFVKRASDHEYSQLSWWKKPTVALIVVGSLLVTWYVSNSIPSRQPPPLAYIIPLSIAMGILSAYIAPWLIRYAPCKVEMHAKIIRRARGDSKNPLKYSDIQNFSWGITTGYSVLFLHIATGEALAIGVPHSIKKTEIEHLLIRENVAEVTEQGAAANP